jgi:hypothetical protein
MPACSHCGREGRGYRKEPKGYVEWHEWAMKLSRTHHQERCPDCGRYTVWLKNAQASVKARSIIG